MTLTPRTHTLTLRPTSRTTHAAKQTAKVVACLTILPTAILAGALLVPSVIAAAM